MSLAFPSVKDGRRARTRRLARIRRHLHWWTAALVLTGFSIACIMTALPLTELLLKFLLYQVHKSIGLSIAELVLIRLLLAWRAGAQLH